jgi:hypothetical protein
LDYTNFQVGETFPLPIQAGSDGGLFQIDANGILFILQLSHTDIIAAEAFRTGKIELALYEENNILFFLYQIDGIFKEGWGDAPLALHLLKKDLLPTPASLAENTIHLYLVDTQLHILLAMRTIGLNEDFVAILKQYTQKQLTAPIAAADYMHRVQDIWKRLSPAAMRAKAKAIQKVPLDIKTLPLH